MRGDFLKGDRERAADGVDQHAVPPTEYDEEWIRETWGWDDRDEFVRSQGRNLRPRIVRGIEIAGIRPKMRVLDVGCGRGEVVLECARQGAFAVGLDYSRPAISLAERARANCPDAVKQRTSFVLGDLKDLDPGLGPFDRVFLLDVVEHLHDWELLVLFRSLKRILSSDGQIIIHTLPNRWLYDVTYARIIRLLMPWLRRNPRSKKEMSIHVNEMSITHLDQLLRECGFECRTWLDERLTAQARWHAKAPLSDRRGPLYRWMANPLVGGVYHLLSKTPARFLITNDIFCIAWQGDSRLAIPPWTGWMERIVCAAGRRWLRRKFSGVKQQSKRAGRERAAR